MGSERYRNWLVLSRFWAINFRANVVLTDILLLFYQNRELNGDDLLTKHRALMSLCDVLHDPENICQALRVGKK